MRTSGRRGIRIALSHYRFMHDRATRLKPDTRLASLLENTSTKRESSTGDFHFIDYQTIQYVWVSLGIASNQKPSQQTPTSSEPNKLYEVSKTVFIAYCSNISEKEKIRSPFRSSEKHR